VEGVGDQNQVHRLRHIRRERQGVGAYPALHCRAEPGNLGFGPVEHAAIDIKGDYFALDQFGERRCEIAIAAAQIEHGHAGPDADGPEHLVRMRPESSPPVAIWHRACCKDRHVRYDQGLRAMKA